MDIRGRINSSSFKVLLHAIFERYFHKGLKLEEYQQGIERGTYGIEKGLGMFFGCQNQNPFPYSSKIKPYHRTRTLKSEILKNAKLILLLKDYYENLDSGDDWKRYSKNFEKGFLQKKYPRIKEKSLKPYLDTINEAGISEAAFYFLAQEFKTKQLYAQYEKLRKGEEYFSFRKNLDVYCTYAGFKNLDEVKEKGRELERLQKEKQKVKIFRYVGFYYIFSTHSVFEEFKFEIDANQKPYKISVHGFYYNSNIEYEGIGETTNGKIYVTLRKKDHDGLHHYVYMIFDCGSNLEERECIRGAFMGVSLDRGHTFNKEIFLIKDTGNLVETYKLSIRRYLFWHRRSFRINDSEVKPKNIKVRDRDVNLYENTVGFWKVWRFDEKFNVLESLLHVRDDYKVVHHLLDINKNYIREFCAFRVSDNNLGNILCMYTYRETKIIDFLMIKIPREKFYTSTNGVAISTKSNSPSPIKRSIILKKEDEKQWNELSESKLKNTVEEKFDVYSAEWINTELRKKKKTKFSKIFNELSKNELSNKLPHWAIGLLDYDYFYKE